MLAIDVAVVAALAVGAGVVAVVVWTFGRLRRSDRSSQVRNHQPAGGSERCLIDIP
jgi:hypothetical protein